MKTAVSIPDDLFKLAEKTAKRLGIPRSQLYTKALEEYIQSHEGENVTEKLNAVYGRKNQEPLEKIDNLSAELLRRSLKDDAW